jgi:low density lipoprotein-related protein 2
MTGKDCRADGPPPDILLASSNRIAQLNLAKDAREKFNPHAVMNVDAEILSVDYDPIRKVMYWIDRSKNMIFRSGIPSGNQSHVGEALDIDFQDLGVVPTALAVDHLSGNVYFTAVSSDVREKLGREKRETKSGQVLVTDGRYVLALVSGEIEYPTAIAVDAELGMVVWTDAGERARMERMDMDGQHREVLVDQLIFFPTSVAIDYPNDHRIYWADPKEKIVEYILPDRSQRTTLYRAVGTAHKPYKLDIFENWVYWLSQGSGQLLKMDKFGHEKDHVIFNGIEQPHAVKIYQDNRYNVSLRNPCNKNPCSHLCLVIPGGSYTCACPTGFSFAVRSNKECTAPMKPLLVPVPLSSCPCINGGRCLLNTLTSPYSCDCSPFGFGGTRCETRTDATKQPFAHTTKGTVELVVVVLIGVLIIVGALAAVGFFLYRRRLLFFKKKEMASSTVSYHGNVVSFTNPVLEHKMGEMPSEYNLTTVDNQSTTFSNPVYDTAEDGGQVTQPGSAVIAPSSSLTAPTRQRSLDPAPAEADHDKAQLVHEDVSDV